MRELVILALWDTHFVPALDFMPRLPAPFPIRGDDVAFCDCLRPRGVTIVHSRSIVFGQLVNTIVSLHLAGLGVLRTSK
jgi:hypothetical protein